MPLPSIVQSSGVGSQNGSSSLTLPALSGSIAAGSHLVVAIWFEGYGTGARTVTGVDDDAFSSYAEDASEITSYGSIAYGCAVWRCELPALGSGRTVTISFSGNVYATGVVYEISSIDSVTPLAGTPANDHAAMVSNSPQPGVANLASTTTNGLGFLTYNIGGQTLIPTPPSGWDLQDAHYNAPADECGAVATMDWTMSQSLDVYFSNVGLPFTTHWACIGLVYQGTSATGRTGSAAITLGALTVAATGTVPTRSGSAAITLDAVTLPAAGTVPDHGALAATLADVTLSATTGTPIVSASLAVSLDSASLSAAGQVHVAGVFASRLAPVTLSAAGSVPRTGSLSVTLAPVVVFGSTSNALSGSAAIQLADVFVIADGISGSIPGPLPAGTLVDSGKQAMIAAKTAYLATCSIGLYTQGLAWVAPQVLADVTPAAWTGYAAVPLTTWSAPFLDLMHLSSSYSGVAEFTNGESSPVVAVGWYIFDPVALVLIGGGRFVGGPKQIEAGATLRLVASITDFDRGQKPLP